MHAETPCYFRILSMDRPGIKRKAVSGTGGLEVEKQPSWREGTRVSSLDVEVMVCESNLDVEM